MSNPKLTQERLKELLHYDPETGVFTRVSRSCNRWPDVGVPVGTPDGNGYLMVGIDQVRYKLHRLAFLYQTGTHPSEQIDHKNGVVTDNRWENLREVSGSGNMQNRKVNANSSSGFTGVHKLRKYPCWVARIALNGERKYLGTFDTPESAHSAYLAAKAQLHTFQPTPRDACTTTS